MQALDAFIQAFLATVSLGLTLLVNVAYALVTLNPGRRGGPDVHLGQGVVSRGVRWWEPMLLLMLLDAAVIVFAWYGFSPDSLAGGIVEGWAPGWVCVGGMLLPWLVLAVVAAVLGWAWLTRPRPAGAPAARLAPGAGGRGQSLLEFALVLPLLLVLVMGVFEFGKLFVQYIGLVYTTDNVAQSAAALGGDDTSLATITANSRLGPLDAGLIALQVDTLELDGSTACNGAVSGPCFCEYGQYVRVTARYPASLRILWFNQDVPLGVQNTLRCWRGGAE